MKYELFAVPINSILPSTDNLYVVVDVSVKLPIYVLPLIYVLPVLALTEYKRSLLEFSIINPFKRWSSIRIRNASPVILSAPRAAVSSLSDLPLPLSAT